MFEFRKAKAEEISDLETLVAHARKFMHESGVPQWQDAYPNRSVLEADFEKGELYLMKENGELSGMLVLTYEPDEYYESIFDGEWREGAYAAIHRVAVMPDRRRKGTASTMLQVAEGLIFENGITNVRIDTHEDNAAMRGMLEKSGYEKCGMVLVAETERDRRRVAYQKELKPFSCACGE